MKNIYTYLSVSVISLLLAVACSFLMLSPEAPIQDAGTYLPLILGAVFTWSSTKALLAERDHELHDNAASAPSAA